MSNKVLNGSFHFFFLPSVLELKTTQTREYKRTENLQHLQHFERTTYAGA